jgi:transcriptional regulator with XRE-family HTH domain
MFYDRFKLLCQRKNISCTKAATEMGLSNSTPTKWKKTAAIPDSSTISRIADYFEVPVEYVMGVSADSQIDEANFRLAELEKELKTATEEEADEIAVEIDGLQESLKDMKFSQPFEENAIRQAKKNTRPAKNGTGSAYAQSIYDFVDSCEAGQLADLAQYVEFLKSRQGEPTT